MSGFTGDNVPSLAGKCAVVTGANTGIGFEVAKVLARQGARVLIACRNAEKATAALEQIRHSFPTANLAFVPLDQADLSSVKRAAEIISQEPRLDVLINNAGVMTPPLSRTAQGHEQQFGVNHLGTYALTLLLLPKLADAQGARVVVTSSLAHTGGRIDWDDLDAHKTYKRGGRYSDSKLMNLLFAFELDRRLRAAGSPVLSVACHPGVAATELMRHMPSATRFVMPLMAKVLNTAEQGAWPALQAATGSGVMGGDYYGPQQFFGSRGPSGRARSSDLARNSEIAQRLWQVSAQLTGLDYPAGVTGQFFTRHK